MFALIRPSGAFSLKGGRESRPGLAETYRSFWSRPYSSNITTMITP